MITAYLIGESIVSSSADAFMLYEKSRLGEKDKGRVVYAPVEALFLVSDRRMRVFIGKKEIDEIEFLRRLKRRDRRIESKFLVFKDLRKRGYVVKTALKFGADFRVYDKGVRPGEDHAKWILYSVKASENLKWYEFAGQGRIAHSTRKKLLIAIVDDEGDITYYESGWIRP